MSLQEQEPTPQNIIQAPSEKGHERWSWRNVLMGAAVGTLLGVGLSYIAPPMMGASPESMSSVVQTTLGNMTMQELMVVIVTPPSAILGIIFHTR